MNDSFKSPGEVNDSFMTSGPLRAGLSTARSGFRKLKVSSERGR